MIAPFGLRPKGTLAQRMLPLAQALTAQGHHVRIVAPAYLNPADAGRCEQHGGVEVVHVQLPRTPGPLAFGETAFHLVSATHAGRPDVVHVFKPKGYSGLAALLWRRWQPRIPVVQDTDDWEGWGGWNDLQPYPWAMKHFFAWQERTLPRRAAAVTVASHTLQTQVWGFGVAPERVLYLPNGVSLPPTLPERSAARHQLGLDDAPVVLLYTRFWEYPPHMVQALLSGIATHPAARLLVIGAGERGEEAQLLAWASTAGHAARLDVRGWAAPATIQAAFAAADVAVMPFADTLMTRAKCSVKLLELLNAAVPVVASRVGQAAAYIDHPHTGVLVPPGDGAALAQAALALLADPDRRALLGAAGQQHVQQHFPWHAQAANLAALYQAVICG